MSGMIYLVLVCWFCRNEKRKCAKCTPFAKFKIKIEIKTAKTYYVISLQRLAILFKL